MTEHNRL